jgi:hypothetical protein
MKEEHRQSLLNGETLECPTGYLFWNGKSGYFNCKDPDCSLCEDYGLIWEDIMSYYECWKEDEWSID